MTGQHRSAQIRDETPPLGMPQWSDDWELARGTAREDATTGHVPVER